MERLNRLNSQISENNKNTYEYTQQGNKLTEEQRKFYEDNGYIVIKNLLKKEEYEKWRDRFIQYCEKKLPRLETMVVMRDITLAKKKIEQDSEYTVTKIQQWQDDPVMFEFCKNKIILEYVSDIIGPDIKTIHYMLINKPPNTGKTQRHPLHQDITYFRFRPANQIVCAWSAMEKANRENGGLVIYPGSHKLGFVEHGYPDWKEGVNKAYYGIMKMPDENAIKIHPEMDAGDVVFFHPFIIHGSGENKTQGFRKSISCHYASSQCQYIDPKGTYHEVFDGKDSAAILKSTKYQEYYSNKIMRLVQGKSYEGCI